MFHKKGAHPTIGFLHSRTSLMATTTLIGTIVGAGILAIPYSVAKVGIIPGLFLIIGLGLIFLFINLCVGEIVLRTQEKHQLTGYAQKYLGRGGRILLTITMFLSITGALMAYLIGEGQTLYSLLGIGSPVLYSFLFFIISSFIVYHGIKATSRAELFLIGILFLVVLLLGIFSIDTIDPIHFDGGSISYFFLPYGIILFAFMGLPAIPEAREVLARNTKQLKTVILVGSIIPIFLYIIFSIVVVGIVGIDNFEALSANDRIATIALNLYANSGLAILANILAILTMFTSFLTLSTALTQVYEYDYKFSRPIAFFMTFTIPFLAVMFGVASFFRIISLTGAMVGAIEGVVIIFMFWAAKKYGDRTPEYSIKPHYGLGALIILLFVIGLLSNLWG